MQLGICGTLLLALVWYSSVCELSRLYDLWTLSSWSCQLLFAFGFCTLVPSHTFSLSFPVIPSQPCLWIGIGTCRSLGRYVSILDLCLGVSNAWVHHISDLWVGMSAWISGWVCQTSGCTCSGSVVGYLISGSMCRMPECIRSLSRELIPTLHFSSMVELWLGS